MSDERKSGINLEIGDVKKTPEVKTPQAVALKYDRGFDPAPRIVAKGRGEHAKQILSIAFERGIKVREDAPLVEILGMLEVEEVIPLEAYAAVAEILSYVYRADKSKTGIA